MRVAFVVQRCGPEITGGAEFLCLQVAQRMSRHWETEVLTTCARDYMTWEDYYPAGLEKAGGTTIRRFPVAVPRDVRAFDALSAKLHSRQSHATLAEQEAWMRAQGPVSDALFDYISAKADEYDAFIFFGYLYATTYFGLPLVRDKAYLAPFAHDEWTIHFSMWDAFIRLPKSLIFSTPAEQAFLQRRFPEADHSGPVIGIGIEAPPAVDPQRFRERYGVHDKFFLYAGRVDEAKGCRWLIENFIEARNDGRIAGKLVLVGSEIMPIRFHDDVIYLGFLPEADKWDTMAACDWLVMPSPHESLSIVLLEAWATGRPAIVNGKSEVLLDQSKRAHGALWYSDWNEFETIARTVADEVKNRLGQQGRDFVRKEYSWQRIEHEYLKLALSSTCTILSPDARSRSAENTAR